MCRHPLTRPRGHRCRVPRDSSRTARPSSGRSRARAASNHDHHCFAAIGRKIAYGSAASLRLSEVESDSASLGTASVRGSCTARSVALSAPSPNCHPAHSPAHKPIPPFQFQRQLARHARGSSRVQPIATRSPSPVDKFTLNWADNGPTSAYGSHGVWRGRRLGRRRSGCHSRPRHVCLPRVVSESMLQSCCIFSENR